MEIFINLMILLSFFSNIAPCDASFSFVMCPLVLVNMNFIWYGIPKEWFLHVFLWLPPFDQNGNIHNCDEIFSI